ncbi:efflux transporter outer membrane subunit [Methylocaldum sp.]|uniref:efflux transporter outer membrane subunit n=1 Tax=Methylocaldum sp. TaxID=1969727 RepID=UPI00321F6D0F
MNTKLQFSLSLFAMSLAACTVGPDYRAPVPAVPDRWHADEKIGADLLWAKPENLKAWWRAFGDYELDRLMDRALARNLDVKIALARIEQARAERSSTRAELFPSVDVTGGVQRQDNPMPGLRPGIRYNLFEIGFDALWEIDLFGRQQRRLEAASAELEAAGDQYAQSLVTLSSELARSYIDYRNAQALLAITRSNLDSMRQTVAQTERLLQEGIGTRHDVVRAKAQAETTEAQIPTLEAGKTAALRQLEALTGQQPGALAADTIRHRPDLRAAERQLAAATAMQGAAIAELFPKISLSAFLGLRNTDIESLFKSAAFSYGNAANLVQPLLNFGRIKAGIKLAEAKQREAYFAYEKGVLEALKETETALTRYLKEEIRRQTLARAVEDQQEAVRLSQLRFEAGVISLLDVLVAQRALYAVESELANSRALTAVNLISLYKSLGGGANATPPLVAADGKKS